eukprot:3915802-Pleurochrysis_carterae.AAC.2
MTNHQVRIPHDDVVKRHVRAERTNRQSHLGLLIIARALACFPPAGEALAQHVSGNKFRLHHLLCLARQDGVIGPYF